MTHLLNPVYNPLQVAALEELLGFLSSHPTFSGLSRELLTSLAVFIQPISAQPGQVLAMAGQPADALVIIQVRTAPLKAVHYTVWLEKPDGHQD